MVGDPQADASLPLSLSLFFFLSLSLSLSQWSEIRELTHRARRSKMLEGKDKANTQALKAFMGKDGFVI